MFNNNLVVMEFMDKNIKKFIKKDINQLKELYESTDGRLLTIMAAKLAEAENGQAYGLYSRLYCDNCRHTNSHCNSCGLVL